MYELAIFITILVLFAGLIRGFQKLQEKCYDKKMKENQEKRRCELKEYIKEKGLVKY